MLRLGGFFPPTQPYKDKDFSAHFQIKLLTKKLLTPRNPPNPLNLNELHRLKKLLTIDVDNFIW